MLWGILAVFFVVGVYIANYMLKPKKNGLHEGATFAQKHTYLVIILAVVVPIGIGVTLANTAFSHRPKTRSVKKKGHTITGVTAPVVHVDEPEPLLKMIISDGSRSLDISALNRCKADEVTIIEKQLVVCKPAESPQVKAWMLDVKRQGKAHIAKYIQHQKTQHNQVIQPKGSPSAPTPRMQSFGWWAPSTTTKKQVDKEKKPFRHRHAEVFFFLALVLGVLSKYFWDFYEERSQGKKGTFEPHVIVMSFIISALIYYSIQQGLEKEAGKLTTRGILFAFNNGFMWQTILKSTRLSNGSKGEASPNEQPSS